MNVIISIIIIYIFLTIVFRVLEIGLYLLAIIVECVKEARSEKRK